MYRWAARGLTLTCMTVALACGIASAGPVRTPSPGPTAAAATQTSSAVQPVVYMPCGSAAPKDAKARSEHEAANGYTVAVTLIWAFAWLITAGMARDVLITLFKPKDLKDTKGT